MLEKTNQWVKKYVSLKLLGVSPVSFAFLQIPPQNFKQCSRISWDCLFNYFILLSLVHLISGWSWTSRQTGVGERSMSGLTWSNTSGHQTSSFMILSGIHIPDMIKHFWTPDIIIHDLIRYSHSWHDQTLLDTRHYHSWSYQVFTFLTWSNTSGHQALSFMILSGTLICHGFIRYSNLSWILFLPFLSLIKILSCLEWQQCYQITTIIRVLYYHMNNLILCNGDVYYALSRSRLIS